ncbi:MAG: hypothetical protein FJ405_14675 [Verrucomicrobia bacterium]|nr:hypothetical protein [Verrucomicrobiota bacterium]
MPQQRWPSQASSFQAFSGDGQTVAYTAAASSTGGSPGVTNLYLKHLRDGQIWTVDRWNGGNVSLSRDGRLVAYDSEIDVPLLGDSNGSYDVFVWDRQTGVRELVSRTGNRSGNSSSGNSFISASGRFVVFSTDATDLFAGDVNGQRDILLRDRQLGSTRVISANAAGSIGNGFSDDAVVSENGQYVAFMSGSGNLTADPNPNAYQIYLRDWVNNTVVRVSAFPNGV